MELLIKLLLAHLLGDFVFQPNSWVQERQQKLLRSPRLYLHTSIHILLAWGLSMRLDFWKYALIIGVLHFLTDVLKAWLNNIWKQSGTTLFFADQAVHILVLISLSLWLSTFTFDAQNILLWSDSLPWLRMLGFVFVSWPAAVLIRFLISPFAIEAENMGIRKAGRWIGMLERVLVLTFILTGHWEGVGFLLAAKSVFRFGDLRQQHDIRLTEYILIGTLLSFGLAILTGIIVS